MLRFLHHVSAMTTKPPPKRSQAKRIFAKFGGAGNLHKALAELADATGDEQHRRDRSVIYRWDLPKAQGGTGGFVPISAMPSVMQAARRQGVLLTTADTAPMEA